MDEAGLLEESIAEANRALREGRIAEPTGVLGKFNEKFHAFFEGLGNALKGRGFVTAKGVMEGIQSGEIGRRARAERAFETVLPGDPTPDPTGKTKPVERPVDPFGKDVAKDLIPTDGEVLAPHPPLGDIVEKTSYRTQQQIENRRREFALRYATTELGLRGEEANAKVERILENQKHNDFMISQVKDRGVEGMFTEGNMADDMITVNLPEGRRKVPGGVGIMPNSDAKYIITTDYTTDCVRRQEQTQMVYAMSRERGKPLEMGEIYWLAARMKEDGKLSSCAYCYVDAPRWKAQQILADWLDANHKGNEKIDYAYLTDGAYRDMIKRTQPDHPALTDQKELYAHILKEVKYPMVKGITPSQEYGGQLLALAANENGRKVLDIINKVAGLRFQSNSDFVINHVVDIVQQITDAGVLARAGIPVRGHIYVKVPEAAEFLANTGMKVNMSTSFSLDPTTWKFIDESHRMGAMPIDEALRIRENDKSGNVGIVAVLGIENQIRKILMEPEGHPIDYIIPFHRSGVPGPVYKMAGWMDFTHLQSPVQYSRFAEGKQNSVAKKWYSENMPRVIEYIDTYLKENGSPTRFNKEAKVADTVLTEHDNTRFQDFSTGSTLAEMKFAYIEHCAVNGIIPVFPNFIDTPGYMRLRKDYARTDTPFTHLEPNFNFDAIEKLKEQFFKEGSNAPLDRVAMDKYSAEMQEVAKRVEVTNSEKIDRRNAWNEEAAKILMRITAERGVNVEDVSARYGETMGRLVEGARSVIPIKDISRKIIEEQPVDVQRWEAEGGKTSMRAPKYSPREETADLPAELPKSYRPLINQNIMKEAFPKGVDAVKLKELLDNPTGEIPDAKTENYINFKYVDGPDALRELHAAVSDHFTTEIQTARGAPESWGKTFEKAQKFMRGDGSVDSMAVRQAASSAMLQAGAKDVMAAMDAVRQEAAKIGIASPENIQRQEVAMQMLVALEAMDQGVGADVARALNLRKAAKQSALLAEQLLGGNTKFGADPVKLATLFGDMKTVDAVIKLNKAATKATAWDMIIEAWKSGLVSGPVTHVTNLFGTEAFAFMRIPVDAVASLVGAARGEKVGIGEGQRLSAWSPVFKVMGMIQGHIDGAKVAFETFTKGSDITGKAEAYNEAIPGTAGHIIRTPFRFLSAEDAFVSTVIKRGEQMSLAATKAIGEGLNPFSREFTARVNELMTKPDPAFQAEIDAAGQRFTFNEPFGPKGRSVSQFVREWKLQWAVPFIRTPLNIAEELLRMSAFAPAVKSWREAIAKGGIERDRALAELALGSGIMAVTMSYAMAGNISGNGSPDPGRRKGQMAAGWQPYSVKIGDTWYNYQRIQPTGTLIGMAADVAEIWDKMTEEEQDKIPKMMAAAFSNAITNQTFLQGISTLVSGLSDPTRYGARVAQQLAGSMVPNIIGQPTAMTDPVVREVNSVLEAVKARIPGLRQELLPKLDAFGKQIETKERLGFISPVTETTISKEEIRLELDRLGISIPTTPKKLHVGRGTGKMGEIELSPEQRNKYGEVSGAFAERILSAAVNNPQWADTPLPVKRKIYQRAFGMAHRMGAMAALPPDQRTGVLVEAMSGLAEQMGER